MNLWTVDETEMIVAKRPGLAAALGRGEGGTQDLNMKTCYQSAGNSSTEKVEG